MWSRRIDQEQKSLTNRQQSQNFLPTKSQFSKLLALAPAHDSKQVVGSDGTTRSKDAGRGGKHGLAWAPWIQFLRDTLMGLGAHLRHSLMQKFPNGIHPMQPRTESRNLPSQLPGSSSCPSIPLPWVKLQTSCSPLVTHHLLVNLRN